MKRQKNQTSNFILAFLFLAVLIGGMLIIWYSFGKPLGKPDQTSQAEFDNWKTYQNNQVGYQLKYPTNYFVVEKEEWVEIAWDKWQGQSVNYPYLLVKTVKTNQRVKEWVGKKIEEKENQQSNSC